jgi:transcriptional regulator with XRE-family HTH domain
MSDQSIGRSVRALRHRLRWRQEDLGARAGVSQDLVSLVERGRIGHMTVRRLRDVCSAVDAELVMFVRWRAGDLDRLLDEGHATLLARVASLLEGDGWQVVAEATFAIGRESGSIDLLAWHPMTRTLLVVEVKTELTSLEETLRRHDLKVRLAGRIAAERMGWRPGAIGRLLVLPDLSTARRRVGCHDASLSRVYPLRGADCRAWLRRGGAGSGVLFLTPIPGRRVRGPIARKRVRRSGASIPEREPIPVMRPGVSYDGRA